MSGPKQELIHRQTALKFSERRVVILPDVEHGLWMVVIALTHVDAEVDHVSDVRRQVGGDGMAQLVMRHHHVSPFQPHLHGVSQRQRWQLGQPTLGRFKPFGSKVSLHEMMGAWKQDQIARKFFQCLKNET